MRKIEEVQQEYQQLCAMSGDMSYKIRCIQKDLRKIELAMLKLNKEAQRIEEANKRKPQPVPAPAAVIEPSVQAAINPEVTDEVK